MLRDFSVTVPGTDFKLESNKSYRVEIREDTEAGKVKVFSDDAKKSGTVMHLPYIIPNGFSTVTVTAPYDAKRKIWDTGLYESSQVYLENRVDRKQIKETVETLKEYLIPSLSLGYPKGALEPDYPEANAIFDHLGDDFHLKPGRIYQTNNARDFFLLWLAFLSDRVVDEQKDKEKSSAVRNKNIPFVLRDNTFIQKNSADQEYEKTAAKSKFFNMVSSEKEYDKNLVVDVVNYLGFTANKKTDTPLLVSSFNNWIDNKNNINNAKDFNEKVKYFSTEDGEQELDVYKKLLEGVKNSKVIRQRGEYFLQGENIGARLKEAAKKISKDDNLLQLLLETIE